MGKLLFDQYTLLHFAVGVIAYFWNVGFWMFMIIHTLFEIVENTKFGMSVINNYIRIWPGGKPQANNILNRVGDTFGGGMGWICAWFLDSWGKSRGWHL